VIVPREDRSVDTRQLLADLKQNVSPYKVPAELHVMAYDDVPRTDAGKPRKPLLKERLAS